MSESTGVVFDLAGVTVGLDRDGGSQLFQDRPGPPPRIDGFAVGAPLLSGNAPHGGEMHPDGDELLILLSGRVDVVLESEGGERKVAVSPGQGVIVPRGVWHRVLIREPSRIVFVTPGPGGEHRPLASD